MFNRKTGLCISRSFTLKVNFGLSIVAVTCNGDIIKYDAETKKIPPATDVIIHYREDGK
ncbi:MAG: hypothetical protein V9E88_03515 [Ferruginibacter sp.]